MRACGVAGRVRVGSPTFSLVHEYETPRGLVLHVDSYRLGDTTVPLAAEIQRLGLREARGDGAVLLVEWGEGARDFLGAPAALTVRLGEGALSNQREATLEGPLVASVTA